MKKTVFAFLLCISQFAICNPSFAATADTEKAQLPGGSTLVVRADRIAPRAAISLMVRAGAADETGENAGWRQVLTGATLRASLLPSEGNAPAEVRFADWQRQAERWGGEIGATVGSDFIEIWATGDSTATSQMLRSVLQIALHPRLSDGDIASARRRILTLQNRSADGIASRATQSISGQLYQNTEGEPLAYALPNYGTFESLGALDSDELRALHQRFFVPSRITVAAAGDVDFTTLRSELEAATADEQAPAGAPAPTTDPAPKFAPLSTTPPLVVREMGSLGAWVFLAYRAPAPAAMTAKEYAALKVFSAALDGGALARLPRRLRNNVEPLGATPAPESAGQVASQFTSRRFANELTVFAQTSPQNVDAVKNALLDEVRKLRESPLNAAELQSARNFAHGTWATSRESPRERAFEAGAASIYGALADSEWPTQIQSVTAADVQNAAEKYLNNYSVVLIMPEEL